MFFYLSKFEQVFDEKAQTTIIHNIQKEINEAKPVSKHFCTTYTLIY